MWLAASHLFGFRILFMYGRATAKMLVLQVLVHLVHLLSRAILAAYLELTAQIQHQLPVLFWLLKQLRLRQLSLQSCWCLRNWFLVLHNYIGTHTFVPCCEMWFARAAAQGWWMSYASRSDSTTQLGTSDSSGWLGGTIDAASTSPPLISNDLPVGGITVTTT
jgi:hypothetical protein